MKSNVRIFLALVVFAASMMLTDFAKAAGCPGTVYSLRSDGYWACSLKSEGINACTYYNDTAHCEIACYDPEACYLQ